jgi:hypothetical protein
MRNVSGSVDWDLAVASATTTSTSMLVMGTRDADKATMLIEGVIRADSNISTSSVGDIVYLSDTAEGGITTTAPASSGDVVRILGYVLSPTYGVIYFSPDKTWVEIK